MRFGQTGDESGSDEVDAEQRGENMIRKLPSGEYRLLSRKPHPATGKRRNLGTFGTREAAQKHERQIGFFRRRPRGPG